MQINPVELGKNISQTTGVVFNVRNGIEAGEHWIAMHPKGHSKSSTFTIKVIVGWRHLEVHFAPGSFSGDLLNIMKASSNESVKLFTGLLDFCKSDGATISMKIDNQPFEYNDNTLWKTEWVNVELNLRIGQLNFKKNDLIYSQKLVEKWTYRLTNAVLSLIPLDTTEDNSDGLETFPEGASIKVKVNRFERNQRNRAVALIIHGYQCKACDIILSNVYGPTANNFIEVHHIVPVSEIGDNYMINPATDLVPLCPNCHAIAHKRNPPYSLTEIRELISKNSLDGMTKESL